MAEFKPAWYQRDSVLAAVALAIALAAHLIFAMSVRHVPSRPAFERTARASIKLVTPRGLKSQKAWDRLHRWVDRNDPAIVADSDSALSYSALRPEVQPQRSLQKTDRLDFFQMPPLPPSIPLADAEVRHPAVEDLIWRGQQSGKRTAEQEPLFTVFDETMRPVKLPALELLMKQELPSGWQPAKTKLQATRIVWRSRVPEMIHSCGEPALDRLALTAVNTFRTRPAGFRRLSVYWHWPIAATNKVKP